ncbi:hypothetical protein [Nostoc flagelliforme]|uniref:hypothetical protein n=1 Tax=Nostoc flagelliforme TaxID=1306274 RepID=UPI0012FDC1F6
MNTSYTIRKKSVLYLLLGNNRAIAGYTKALEFRNGKSFRRVTEEGYSGSQLHRIQMICRGTALLCPIVYCFHSRSAIFAKSPSSLCNRRC